MRREEEKKVGMKRSEEKERAAATKGGKGRGRAKYGFRNFEAIT